MGRFCLGFKGEFLTAKTLSSRKKRAGMVILDETKRGEGEVAEGGGRKISTTDGRDGRR